MVPPECGHEHDDRRGKLHELNQQFHGQSPPSREAPPDRRAYAPPTLSKTIARLRREC
jgi:hypothetical protein